MRIPLATAFVLVAACGVSAAELPIRAGVSYCTDSLDIDATGVYGPDHQCFAVSAATDNGAVLLLCEPGEPRWGPPWVETVTLIEDVEAGTLLYVGEDGPEDLMPCPVE